MEEKEVKRLEKIENIKRSIVWEKIENKFGKNCSPDLLDNFKETPLKRLESIGRCASVRIEHPVVTNRRCRNLLLFLSQRLGHSPYLSRYYLSQDYYLDTSNVWNVMADYVLD